MKETISRRALLRRGAGLGLVVLGLGCGGRKGTTDCTDTSTLTPTQRSSRSSLGYVDHSPHGAEKDCASCRFYTPGDSGECGRCTLVPGPIAPDAYCDSWGAKS